MDEKTYEYMKERTLKYDKLRKENNKLKQADEAIKRFGAYKVCDFYWGQSELENIGPRIKEYVLKAIEERLAEIEKEKGEI